MGLLDEFKREADSVLTKQRSSQDALNEKLQAAHVRLKDALQFWVQLFNSLNVVKPDIRRNYYIEGSAQLENLLQCDYNVNGRRLTVDHHDYIDAIVLRFRCTGTQQLTLQKESQSRVDGLRQHLWSHGLKFDLKETKREGAYVDRGIFSITPEIAVTLTIAADIDNSQVKLTVRNLERLGDYTYVYDYAEFTAVLLEEIAKVILARPHKLRAMGTKQAETLTTRATVARS
jgi:hypothetical protein